MQYRNIMITTINLGFLVGLAVGVTGCTDVKTEANSSHCAQQDGDATCVQKTNGARPYCAKCGDGSGVNDGCVADVPTDLECYSPCGGMQSFDENSSCVEVGEEGGDGDGDGDGDGGDGDGDGESMACSGPTDCADEAAPFCNPDSGLCVACDEMADGDGSCANLDAEMPVCADGVCAQCDEGKDAACMDDTPICKVDTNACVACIEHEHCSEDSACNLDMNTCIEANIVHVDGSDGVACDLRDGTEPLPYCKLGDALSENPAEALIFLHAEAMGAAYQEKITINEGMIVIIGVPDADGNRPILQGVQDEPALSVGESGMLSLRNVQISKSDGEGLRVMGKAWVEQSLVIGNDGGGIVVDGGALIVENSFVGGDKKSVFAVDVLSGSAMMTYVTLAAGDDMSAALHCDDGTTTVVRNSLLVAETTELELACPGAQVSGSALEQMFADNEVLGEMNIDWFEDYGGQDYHLTTDAPEAIHTAATWKTGDPTIDIDGEPRPVTEDGSQDFAGADVPSP